VTQLHQLKNGELLDKQILTLKIKLNAAKQDAETNLNLKLFDH
jgi:hypothetical protein